MAEHLAVLKLSTFSLRSYRDFLCHPVSTAAIVVNYTCITVPIVIKHAMTHSFQENSSVCHQMI